MAQTVTLLTANPSDALTPLLRHNPRLVDGLEIGPWMRLAELRVLRRELPDMPVYFHGGNLLLKVGWPGVTATAQAYVQASGSPWASMHLFIWPYWMAWLMYRYPIRLPRLNPERETRRLVWQIRRLQRALSVPVTLENIEFVPSRQFIHHVQPALIRRVLEETNCQLLLDLGHARVAAAELGLPERDYLRQLPLERVVQIHVSGPRIKNGRLFDAHDTLQPEDYALLEFALGYTRPAVLTLEYIRDSETLGEQLANLRRLITP